jgi:DNA polymerase III sliding clamp (beta) subunit (PCNA family)
MNSTIKSLITAGGTITVAGIFYLLRHFPDTTQRGTQPQPVVVKVPLVETPPCEPPVSVPVPPRPQPRPIPRPAVERVGLTVKTLLDALALMRPLIQRHPTLPIVECVLLEPGQMTITDLESRLTIQVPELAVSPVCVPAMQLQKALRGIKGSLSLAVDNGRVQITSGGVQLSLTTFPSEEYPAHVCRTVGSEHSPGFVLPLRFADVLPAMSKDESRANLSGVCLDLENGAVVASNGHVLHLVTGDRVAGETPHLLSASAAKTLAQFVRHTVHGKVFRRTINNGKDTTTEVTLYFTVPGVELWTRAVAEEFPDYSQVIPTQASLTRTLVADRATLVAAVEQCLPLTTERMLGVTVRGDATGLVFSVTNPDLGSVTVPVPVQGAEGLTFGVNAQYLLAALQTQDKTVTIRCTENDPKQGCISSPLVLNGGPTKAVLMPMRIF